MKKLAVLVLLSFASVAGALGQGNTSTRPRVAPTPTPPAIENDVYRPSAESAAPPVLTTRNGRPIAEATPTPAAGKGDDEIIKVETNLVTMPVSVLDRDGRFISGLNKKDFKIYEDGVEQKVDYFQSVEQPFTVILMLDVSPSTEFRIDEIQNSAIAFINQLRPGDRVEVVAFDEHTHILTRPTSDRNELQNAIRTTQFGDGTSLYEAVDQVMNRELRNIQGRKAVVLFTDGVDTTSRRASYEGTVRDAEESDALFYTVRFDTSGFGGRGGGYGRGGRGGGGGYGRGISLPDILGGIMGGNVNVGRGGGGNGGDYARGKRYLEEIAQASGGREFEADSIYNADAAFSGIAEELRRQYSIGYYPEKIGQVGERRQIKVRVMRPEVVVRAKNSYIVGQTDNRNIAGK